LRLDLFLVKSEMATSRTQAQDLIENKYVILKSDEKTLELRKPSFEVTEQNEKFISVLKNPLQKYVSRAGLKLEGAIQELQLNLKNKVVLDVGQSTGGFTDALLKHGVDKVVGIDVGHDQLHLSLKKNPNVVSIEGLNVKDIGGSELFQNNLPFGGFQLVVMDVSFISISKVVDFMKPYLGRDGEFLFLVKPQFEAGPDALDKNGIVKDEKVYDVIENQLTMNLNQVFGKVIRYFNSTLPGKDGNREFFIYGKNIK
jgi:23S rRNA (cytidine1920-2'-O)/16S rRNA (cytidine1409-2'-O)-methyltransferase